LGAGGRWFESSRPDLSQSVTYVSGRTICVGAAEQRDHTGGNLLLSIMEQYTPDFI
jgi:hypothetical protein